MRRLTLSEVNRLAEDLGCAEFDREDQPEYALYKLLDAAVERIKALERKVEEMGGFEP